MFFGKKYLHIYSKRLPKKVGLCFIKCFYYIYFHIAHRIVTASRLGEWSASTSVRKYMEDAKIKTESANMQTCS